MNSDLMIILACPICGGDLFWVVKDDRLDRLECMVCRRKYKVKDGIPRFVSSDAYLRNFSVEWDLHRKTQLDSQNNTNESALTFARKTGFHASELTGKLVLDAGCGAGRFTEIASDYGAKVIGVDMSESVDSAQCNLRDNENVRFIQGDIMNLPFKKGVFDYIFSIGVLHHTPDTWRAFRRLLPYLKEGGYIAIWVYSDEPVSMRVYNRVSGFYRLFTTKMPLKMLYALSHLAIPYYYLNKIPVVGKIFRVFPCSLHPDKEWRVLDTFDWYSPKYAWKHKVKEVVRWFEDEGLSDVIILDAPVAVKGRKA